MIVLAGKKYSLVHFTASKHHFSFHFPSSPFLCYSSFPFFILIHNSETRDSHNQRLELLQPSILNS